MTDDVKCPRCQGPAMLGGFDYVICLRPGCSTSGGPVPIEPDEEAQLMLDLLEEEAEQP